MNDVTEALGNLLATDGDINLCYYGNDDEIHALNDFLHGHCHDFERPDAYYVFDKQILIVEHFRHDCYKRTSKGSKGTEEDRRIDREFDKLLETGSPSTFHDVIDVNSSYNQYIQNVILIFDDHYRKIDAYVDRVKKDIEEKHPEIGCEILRVCFLIEDKSLLPPTVQNEKGCQETILLLRSKEFLEHLANRPRVDWVMSIPAQEGIVSFYSQKYSKDSLADTRPYAELKFIPLTPHTVGGIISIPVQHDQEDLN